MPYKITILKDKDYITSEWSGGKTTQMHIHPEDSQYKSIDFKWRISSATVELDESDFTQFDGVYRFITILENDLKLTHDYKEYIELKPFEIYEFRGDIKTHSYGKAKDFNLMLANGAKGKLESIYLDLDIALTLVNESGKNQTQLFFSYKEELSIKINDKQIWLNPKEILILVIDSNSTLKIGISVASPTHILYAEMTE